MDFLGIPNDLTVWKILNSQMLETLVGAVVALLVALYGNRAAVAARDTAAAQGAISATEQAKQLEEDAEAEVAAEQAVPEERGLDPQERDDRREEAKQIVDEAKKFLNDKSTAADGRHRRTYKAINRHDYIPLALAMNLRKDLSGEQLTAAVELFSRWRYFERGKASRNVVSAVTVGRLKKALEDLKRPK